MKPILIKFGLTVALTIALLATRINAQTIMQSSGTLALTNMTVIDGNGGRPKPNMTLIISNGRISDMYRTGRKKPPVGAAVIDLSGQYVMPGLIDSHYHFILGTRSKAEEEALRRFALLGGITAVRDMAGDGIALAELARTARDSNVQSPRVYFSAVMAGSTWFGNDQRVGIMMHGLPSGEAAWARAIKPGTDIAKVVVEAKAAGATGIKLYADLSPDTVAKITKEAHRQGLKVWSHATIFPSKPSDAVAAGVDVISHSVDLMYELVRDMPATTDTRPGDFYRILDWNNFPVDAPAITSLLRRMKREGTMLDATVAHTHTRYVLRQLAKPEAERTIRDPQRMDDFTFGVTRRANELGVLIVAGTDFQEAPRQQEFPNIHGEMGLLVTKCGLTPLEAITTATRNGAIALGTQNSYGTIAKGKIADLVILSADPSINIRNSTKIVYVIKGGKLHKREKVTMPAT